MYDYASSGDDDDARTTNRQLVVVRNGQGVFTEVVESYLRLVEFGKDGYPTLICLPAYRFADVVVDPRHGFRLPRARWGARAGCTLGSVDSGALLDPETLRKLACDAGIIPVVLGGGSEVLDVGRTERLFTAGQVKALWLRDKHCTFPGCETPAHWCDAHHLRHWANGGATDLGNAALLCGRHHTVVHRDQLAAAIVDGQVLWDRRPGSYQRQSTAAA